MGGPHGSEHLGGIYIGPSKFSQLSAVCDSNVLRQMCCDRLYDALVFHGWIPEWLELYIEEIYWDWGDPAPDDCPLPYGSDEYYGALRHIAKD